ncbi:MAG: hypothetical protein KKH83_06710 [Candidatus Margulisbacteria bacterium]|nr:hypothetical protein [Candidatus Margulisiibacteriota bacterium]
MTVRFPRYKPPIRPSATRPSGAAGLQSPSIALPSSSRLQLLRSIPGDFGRMAISPNAEYIVAVGNGKTSVFRTSDGVETNIFAFEAKSIEISPDSRLLALHAGPTIAIYDIKERKTVNQDWIVHVERVVFGQNSKYIALRTDNPVQPWEIVELEDGANIAGRFNISDIQDVVFSPNEEFVVIVGRNIAKLYNVGNGEELSEFGKYGLDKYDFEFSPDSKKFSYMMQSAYGNRMQGCTESFPGPSFCYSQSFPGPSFCYLQVTPEQYVKAVFSSDAKTILIKTVTGWELYLNGSINGLVARFGADVSDLRFTTDSCQLIGYEEQEKKIIFYDGRMRAITREIFLEEEEDEIRESELLYCDDSLVIVSVAILNTAKGYVRVYDIRSGEKIAEIETGSNKVGINKSGRQIAVCGPSGIQIYQISSAAMTGPDPRVAVIAKEVRLLWAKRKSSKERSVRSFINRGHHPSPYKYAGAGDIRDFESRVPQPGEAFDPRDIDHHASARLGRPAIRERNIGQRKQTVLVIDPRLIGDRPKEGVEAAKLVGVLAQGALRTPHDEVGAIVGGEILPLSGKSKQLEAIIKKSLDAGGSMIKDIKKLKQAVMASGARPGAEVYLVSQFQSLDDLRRIPAMLHALKKLGYVPKIVKVGVGIGIGKPTISTRKLRIEINDQMIEQFAKWVSHSVNETWEKLRCGRVVIGKVVAGNDLELRVSRAVRFVEEDKRLREERLDVHPGWAKGQEIYEQSLYMDVPAPSNLALLLEEAERSPANMAKLFLLAKIKGWGEVLDYYHNMISMRLQSYSYSEKKKKMLESLIKLMKDVGSVNLLKIIEDQGGKSTFLDEIIDLNEVRGVVFGFQTSLKAWWPDRWLGEYARRSPNLQELEYGPGRRFVEAYFEAKAAGCFETVRIEEENLLNNAPIFCGKPPSPQNSGVDKKDLNKKDYWLGLERPLLGDSAMLVGSIGTTLDPKTCEYSNSLPEAALDIGGGQKVKAKLKREVDKAPIPLGGKISRTKGSLIEFELAGEKVSNEWLNISLTEYRAKMAGQKDLLTAIPLEEAPKEWRDLLEVIERAGLTVGQAIETIQAFVMEKYPYRGYEGAAAEMFAQLKERLAKGEGAGSNEYLKLILQIGCGHCCELSEITLNLLRLAGLPTVKLSGWLAKGKKVGRIGHEVAAVVFPSSREGKLLAKVVETAAGGIGFEMSSPKFARTKRIINWIKSKMRTKKTAGTLLAGDPIPKSTPETPPEETIPAAQKIEQAQAEINMARQFDEYLDSLSPEEQVALHTELWAQYYGLAYKPGKAASAMPWQQRKDWIKWVINQLDTQK